MRRWLSVSIVLAALAVSGGHGGQAAPTARNVGRYFVASQKAV